MGKNIEKTMNGYLEEKFKEYADNTAMTFPEANISYTYKELSERVNSLAKGLIAVGVQKETHVALLAPTSPDWILYFLAITKLGGIPVCLNDKNTMAEIKSLITHSDSTVLITSKECIGNDTTLFDTVERIIFLEETISIQCKVKDTEMIEFLGKRVSNEILAEYVAKASPEDALLFLDTVGTTDNPKAVMLGQGRILNNVLTFIDNFGYTQEDIILSALPLFHVMGCLFTAILIFMAGGQLVLTKKFSIRKALQIIQDIKCTSFHGVPTMYQFMLKYCKDYDVTSLKKGMIAGAYCVPEVFAEIQDKLGMEYVFAGELGFLDKEGYLTSNGRKKELIIRGGENISPSEIEDVIRTYAMVHDVAVVGVPDKVLGEEIAAFIQMKPGANFSSEEVMTYIRQNLPKCKTPKFIYYMEEMPMTSTGKILKKKLVEMITEPDANMRIG